MFELMFSSPAALFIFVVTIGLSLQTLFANPALLDKLMLRPYEVAHERKWWQLITSGFIHGDMMHLIFNMLTFFFFAFALEQYLGSLQFLIVYFGSMILADVSSIFKNKNNPNYASLGASGAIAGVMFSFILFNPTATLSLLILPIPIPAPIFAVLYLAYSYFSGKQQYDNVNHEAHLWGAVAGFFLTILLYPGVIQHFMNEVF
ncbi:MAG TPA: rhomboid family intramembrane serine protease [Patescibacteria group bacterium]|nr:rhomboid family intramembrane serine protease [Patescibacteria group bacterium]